MLTDPVAVETDEEKTTRIIREHNDLVRSWLSRPPLASEPTVPHTFVMTQGLVDTGIEASEITAAVSSYNSFSPDNDPWNEHVTGFFSIKGYRLMWKFDYYDSKKERGSNDPSDPSMTHRVLTIFLAKEY